MSIQISGQQVAVSPGSPAINIGPFVIVTSSQGAIIPTSLTSGANTITVPTTWTPNGLIIVSTGSTSLILKGVTGDTGNYISPANPFVWCFDTITPHIPVSFVLTAGANCEIVLQYF